MSKNFRAPTEEELKFFGDDLISIDDSAKPTSEDFESTYPDYD